METFTFQYCIATDRYTFKYEGLTLERIKLMHDILDGAEKQIRESVPPFPISRVSAPVPPNIA